MLSNAPSWPQAGGGAMDSCPSYTVRAKEVCRAEPATPVEDEKAAAAAADEEVIEEC